VQGGAVGGGGGWALVAVGDTVVDRSAPAGLRNTTRTPDSTSTTATPAANAAIAGLVRYHGLSGAALTVNAIPIIQFHSKIGA